MQPAVSFRNKLLCGSKQDWLQESSSSIDETGNVDVLAVVQSLFVFYCIILIPVKRIDKKDLEKVRANP